MAFLQIVSNKETTPKEVAKDRLKLILIHDRGALDPNLLEKIREEIVNVISKYLEVEPDEVDIALNKAEDEEGYTEPALVASIPIKNLRGR